MDFFFIDVYMDSFLDVFRNEKEFLLVMYLYILCFLKYNGCLLLFLLLLFLWLRF